MSSPKAIIIGATSGIGRALAKEMANHGYELGLTGRRVNLLAELQQELTIESHLRAMDVTKPEEARQILGELVEEMGGMDVIVLNSGVGTIDPSWESEKRVIEVNVVGFVALANWAMAYFTERGGGHIVGISSIAALKGYGRTPAYCASKAFISTYMQGLQQKANKKRLGITVTDIKPGFVATPMTEKNKGMFWVAPVEKAARQIYRAIARRKRYVYITRRWRIVGWITKAIPDWLYVRLRV